MPGKTYDGNEAYSSSSRVSRLLREREIRKNNAEAGTEDQLGVPSTENYSDGNGVKKQDTKRTKQRLLVVANRLPMSAVRKGEDVWSLDQQSSGGLVSALLGVKDYEALWIGWAGVNVPDEVGQRALTKAYAEKKCIPVFLDEDTANQYYNGYCNNILWPVLHYIALPQEDRLSTTRSFESQYNAYKKANQLFADVINELYQEGDVVWCHDFHLMYLPKLLKEQNSAMKVGWFLHSPFPSSEVHRTLPSRSELLKSALAADLVGFHTYDYARHFVSACTRVLGLEGTPEGVEDQGRLIRIATFPIGIDADRFTSALDLPQVQGRIREFKERFAGRKIILGVDRLDMIKGIPQKLLAFEKFLEENPAWREKVVLVQIAVPTRKDVPEYQKLKSHVHEMVGRINGRFGTLDAVPIHHLDQSLDFNGLCALYNVTDVALITSLRDGMNLVSYEFIACQDAKKGVLILSEFAGAAQSLGAGAILVNPWNIIEVANAIGQALDMEPDEIEKRHKLNFAHVSTHTAQAWAENFMSELNDTVVEAEIRTRENKPPLPKKQAIERYVESKNRLVILGFNATLTEQIDTPGWRGDQIKEMYLKLHPESHKFLQQLCNDPTTTVVILSGSGRALLDDNFGEFNMWLAAENGMFLRHTKGEWMTTMPEHLNMDWVDSVKHVFEYFTERTPRSHFEIHETSLVWNYKYSDVEFGRLQARDMLHYLWTGPVSNASVDVIQGSRSVEVRSAGVTKGATIDRILGEIVHSKSMTTPIDYVLCIGHFLGKDEDVYAFFEPVPPVDAFTTRGKAFDGLKLPANGSGARSSNGRSQELLPEKKTVSTSPIQHAPTLVERSSWNVLDLKVESYYSCAVGRARTNARFQLASPHDTVSFLKELAESSS